MATDRFGIDESYHDARGTRHETSRETRAALQAAMGVAPETAAPALDDSDAVRVLLPGGDRSLHGTLASGADLVLEDGTTRPLDGGGALPAEMPFGYHRILRRDGEETLLIVSPGRCFLPDDLRAWGFAAQLYAARSRDSWGIGDLADLTRLGRWTRTLGGARSRDGGGLAVLADLTRFGRGTGPRGGGVLMVNPLPAPPPVPPIEASPYYPSSRRYRNPLYLRIEELPGWTDLPGDLRAR